MGLKTVMKVGLIFGFYRQKEVKNLATSNVLLDPNQTRAPQSRYYWQTASHCHYRALYGLSQTGSEALQGFATPGLRFLLQQVGGGADWVGQGISEIYILCAAKKKAVPLGLPLFHKDTKMA